MTRRAVRSRGGPAGSARAAGRRAARPDGHVIVRLALAAFVLALAGCGAQFSGDVPASSMTEAERDSALARSSVPGSRTVAQAFKFAHKTSRLTVDPDSLER